MSQRGRRYFEGWWPSKSGLLGVGWRRLLLSLVVAAIGITLSALFSWLLLRQESQLAEAQFRYDAARRVELIQRAVTYRLGELETLAVYYAGSELVERNEFHTFAKPLLEKRPGVVAFGWAPHIRAAQREAHEQFVRSHGLSKYQITERDKHGHFVPAGQRPEYWPILFIEPARENKEFLGFDIESNATYREALRRTTTSGQPTASVCDPVERDAKGNILFYVVMPAKDEASSTAKRPADQPATDGFVFGLFDIGATVESVLRPTPVIGIDVSIIAPPSFGGEKFVYTRPARLRRQPGLTAAERTPADLRFSSELVIADSRWQVGCAPLNIYLQRYRTWGPAGILLCGLLATGLLIGYLLLLTGHTARVEAVVAERTRELHESEQRFRRLVDNAGDTIILHAQQDARILDLNERACESLGYTREELLSMTIADVDPDFLSPEEYPVSFEGTHRRKDGTTFPVEIRLTALDAGGQRIMLGLARDITERKKAEKTLDDERRLLRTILDMHERERKLVAYEIHDGLAQQLVGALYKFQSIEPLGDRDPDAARELFDEALRLLREAMAETRRLISGLRPPILEESGLVDAVDYLIAEQRQRGGPAIEFVHLQQFGRLAPPLESAIFRVVQECLTNACRYSQSERVRIELGRVNDHVYAEVRDWGIGFDPAQVTSGHYGLQGIRERAQVLGGSAVIDVTAGEGTRIRVDLPLLPLVENGAAGAAPA
jgi:PAS domain S-box-containing protein